jgi:hypothetical protein
MKRISFDEAAASHLLELAYEHFQDECPSCETIKAKLEKFIGEEEVKAVTKTIKKNGYCNKLKV